MVTVTCMELAPPKIPFGLHSLVVDSLIRSPYGFRAGGDALAKKFVARLESQGGEIRLGAKVRRLHLQGGLVHEIELENSERISAKNVVSGAHPKTTLRWLEEGDLPQVFCRRVNRMEESSGIFGIYAEVSKDCALSRKCNYYFFLSDNSEELVTVGGHREPPRIVFVTRPDREPDESRLTGPLTFHAAGPYEWFREWEGTRGARPMVYKERKGEVAEKVIGFVDSRERGLKNCIQRYETSTPLTNIHFNGSEEGSGYGIYHSMDNTGMRAVGPRTRIKNLFLTGQSTLMPGLLGSAVAGVRSAGELVGLSSVLEDLIRVRDS